jgi:hypothetical protein
MSSFAFGCCRRRSAAGIARVADVGGKDFRQIVPRQPVTPSRPSRSSARPQAPRDRLPRSPGSPWMRQTRQHTGEPRRRAWRAHRNEMHRVLLAIRGVGADFAGWTRTSASASGAFARNVKEAATPAINCAANKKRGRRQRREAGNWDALIGPETGRDCGRQYPPQKEPPTEADRPQRVA